MTLTTHAVTGAALASLIPNQPMVGFAVGFLSHFILDAIPHWDYSLGSMKKDKDNPLNDDMIINKDFVKDILKIGLDAALGLLLSYLIFGFYLKFSVLMILSGALGSMAPDALQFIYMKWRHEPIVSLQRFHIWIHSKIRLDNRPIIGVGSQIMLILLVVWLIKLI